MSRGRLIAAGVMALLLAGVMLFEARRRNEIAACTGQGGLWAGRDGCVAPRPGPILQREDLKRG